MNDRSQMLSAQELVLGQVGVWVLVEQVPHRLPNLGQAHGRAKVCERAQSDDVLEGVVDPPTMPKRRLENWRLLAVTLAPVRQLGRRDSAEKDSLRNVEHLTPLTTSPRSIQDIRRYRRCGTSRRMLRSTRPVSRLCVCTDTGLRRCDYSWAAGRGTGRHKASPVPSSDHQIVIHPPPRRHDCWTGTSCSSKPMAESHETKPSSSAAQLASPHHSE